MYSKAHLHMRSKLRMLCKTFGVTLIEEVKEGDKRYDFYIPTLPPIVVEVDGEQHFRDKADGHMFKTDMELMQYKKNDKERDSLHKRGNIKLYRFKTSEFPSLSELIEILDIELIKKGDNPNDAFRKRIEHAERIKRERKEKAREFRKQTKERDNDGNRPVKKLSRYSYSEY